MLVARVESGSDLLLSIREIVDENGIRAGVILSCVGALGKARVRNTGAFPEELPVTDANRSFLTIEGRPLEILGPSGNVTEIQGKPLVHAHAVLSVMQRGEVSVIAGHPLECAVVYSFAELILSELGGLRMEKVMDQETKTSQLLTE